MGMRQTGKRPSLPHFDAAKADRICRTFVPGAILERVSAGQDLRGRPFAPYTAAYRRTLQRGGEDQRVDLRLTGGLLASIKLRSSTVTPSRITVVVAPDTGTSPAVIAAGGRMRQTGRRGPPHNVLAEWIHKGTPTMRARPFLGLSPADEAELRQILISARVFS